MNVGILWDIENVTPPSGMNFVQSIIDAVSTDGRLSFAMAFGDWTTPQIARMADEMSSCNFELIHTPHGGKKNSTDMSLVAHGVELIFQYPHVERFVLVSGDGDFRPLLLTQRKHGKETWVVCDVNNSASEDLIKMADHSLDYRDIIKEVEDIDDQGGAEPESPDAGPNKEHAFELFKETVGLMLKEGNKPASGGVKSRMKLLNPQFDERVLGYRSWLAFVQDAKDATRIKYKNGAFEFTKKNEPSIPTVFQSLMDALPTNGRWELFTMVAQKIDCRSYGYKKFKDLVLDAEKRGYVVTKNEGVIWSVRRDYK
ncbi:MAG: NYN domain-containing protein [Clostridiales Family XIII bacterium]|jgi:predicted nuclease of predicted toxin-antitoxin system|nr:NYN domain-containing protein [Clostridiales Family XIII bacterium]